MESSGAFRALALIGLSWTILNNCGQDYNSNSGDEVYSTDHQIPDGSPIFQEAFAILREKCMGCHLNTHTFWKTLKTEQAWKAAGYVTPGDKDNSSVMTKLTNEGGNMPLGTEALSQREYEVLVQWVREMK